MKQWGWFRWVSFLFGHSGQVWEFFISSQVWFSEYDSYNSSHCEANGGLLRNMNPSDSWWNTSTLEQMYMARGTNGTWLVTYDLWPMREWWIFQPAMWFWLEWIPWPDSFESKIVIHGNTGKNHHELCTAYLKYTAESASLKHWKSQLILQRTYRA